MGKNLGQQVPLVDYRMTRLTFGVSASSFAANMSVKQNATKYPLTARVIEESIYVDDCITGADIVEGAIQLQGELQNLFNEQNSYFRSGIPRTPPFLSVFLRI